MKNHWLYVHDGKLSGIGIDLVIAQQLQALSEAGERVDLVARGRSTLPGIRNRGCALPPTKLFNWLPARYYYGLNKRYFSWLGARRLGEEHCGVISWSKSALAVFQAARQRGLRCILNVGNFHCDHAPDDAGSRWPAIDRARLRAEYALADRILVASDYAASTFVAHGVPAEKLRVIYRGVDTKRFSPLTDKPTHPFTVISCGQLGERKGTHLLLQAWRQAALHDARLQLVGTLPAEEETSLRALATDNVEFLGFRRDVPVLMRNADVHVLLSRHEGFAKVLIEAAASGLPNICTLETGFPADHGGAAVIVPDRDDVSAVANALRRLHDDPGMCESMGKAARHLAQEEYRWESFRGRFRQAIRLEAEQETAPPVLRSMTSV